MTRALICACSLFAVLHAEGAELSRETILALVARLPAFATPGPRSELAVGRRMAIPESEGQAHFVEITWREAAKSRTALLGVVKTEKLDAGMKPLASLDGWSIAQLQEDANWDTLIGQLMEARSKARQASAVGNIRTMLSAQMTFAAVAGNGAYAADLKCLVTPRSCGVEAEPFLYDDFLAPERMGYRYTLTPTGATSKLRSGARTSAGFLFTAVPGDAEPMPSFCANQDGLICRQEAGTPLVVSGTTCPKGCTPLQ
jgi:hypothetical protein